MVQTSTLRRSEQEPLSPNVTDRVPLGRTRLAVTRFGLGTGPLGHLYAPVSDYQAEETIETAYERGIRLFDTAPLYGAGLAERRLGSVLSRKPRADFVLSTKVGRLVDTEGPSGSSHVDFSYDGIMRSFDESLRRLGLDRVDILHVHNPPVRFGQATQSGLRALRKLRNEGSIAAVGVGMNSARTLARLARIADFDCFLLANRFTLLDRTAERELLPICLKKQIAIIAGGVYNSGLLAVPGPDATFDYRPASPSLIARAQALAIVCERHNVPLKAAALQFPLRHPGVNAVLIGPRSVTELDENLSLANFRIPQALWQDVESSKLPVR